MRYCSGMKAAIVKRLLPSTNESVTDVSPETGVTTATIYYWRKQAADGMWDVGDGHVRPGDRSAGEKLTLLARFQPACEVIGSAVGTFHRWRHHGNEDRRITAAGRISRKLSDDEREHIAAVCCKCQWRAKIALLGICT